MESALTPREIQARIRGGESLEEVAQAAGVSVEQIDAYAGPVLAEREHAATLARTSQVRRHRESGVQRLLGEVVADALAAAVCHGNSAGGASRIGAALDRASKTAPRGTTGRKA